MPFITPRCRRGSFSAYLPICSHGDEEFSLSWLQILDLDHINSYLTPNRCHIEGVGVDPVVDDYILKGLNTNRNSEESARMPPRRCSPESWSAGCWLLPFSHTAIIASNTSHPISLLKSLCSGCPGTGGISRRLRHHSETFFRFEIVDGTNLTAALNQKAADPTGSGEWRDHVLCI